MMYMDEQIPQEMAEQSFETAEPAPTSSLESLPEATEVPDNGSILYDNFRVAAQTQINDVHGILYPQPVEEPQPVQDPSTIEKPVAVEGVIVDGNTDAANTIPTEQPIDLPPNFQQEPTVDAAGQAPEQQRNQEIIKKKQEIIATVFALLGEDLDDLKQLKADLGVGDLDFVYLAEQSEIDAMPTATDEQREAKAARQKKLNDRATRQDVYKRLEKIKDPKRLEKVAHDLLKVHEKKQKDLEAKLLERSFTPEDIAILLKDTNLKDLDALQDLITQTDLDTALDTDEAGGETPQDSAVKREKNFAEKFFNNTLTAASRAFLHGVKTSNMDRLIDALMGINTQGAIGTTADLGSFYKNIEGESAKSLDFTNKIKERSQEFAAKLYDAKEDFKTAGMPLDERLFLDPLRKAARADTQIGALPDLKLALHYIVRMIYHHPDGQKIATVLFEPFTKALFNGKVLSGEPAKEVLEILSKENTRPFEGRNHYDLWDADFKTTEAQSK